MAVSAIAALFVVMAFASAFATVFAALAMLMAAATATTAASVACQVLDGLLDLFLRGIAVDEYLACEVEGLACQRVVGVYGDAILLDLDDFGHEVVLLFVLKGDDGSFEDVVMVEVAVDGEDLTVQLVYALRHIVAEGLCGLEGEVELCAFLRSHQILLEGVEREAEA